MKKVVISLARTPERWELFQRTNRHLADVERHEAWDGKGEDRKAIAHFNYTTEDLTYTDGALGCALSHITLWQKAVNQQRPLMIFEDDAISHRRLGTISAALLSLKDDWDVVVWGWNFDCPIQLDFMPGVAQSRAMIMAYALASLTAVYQASPLHPALYPLRWCFGTPCYSVSPAGAEKLLKLLPLRNFTMRTDLGDVKNTGIDVVLNMVYAQLRAFACFPPLVITPNDKSTSTVNPSPEKAQA